jgi:DNA polymerase III subunit gamma/tau
VSYQVFARKYRPQTFDEIVGQEHVAQTLKNAIEQNRLAHAYLFVGPRGTGKTSTARILAKALNCDKGPTVSPCGVCDVCREIAEGRSFNVLEFDAASNTQVDKVRELIIDNVKYAPTKGRYKVYIVDEVHMLSNSSFNALLKTLEEPPAHVIFIFATTEVNKVPLTILSRCQRFDLRRIPASLIAKHLDYIAKNEQIALDDRATHAIARGAEGGLRDAESMLDQLVAFCGNTINEEDVLSVFGFTSAQTVSQLCDCILGGDSRQALGVVHQQAEAGKDLSQLMSDLISHLRDLLVVKADPDAIKSELGDEAASALKSQSEKISMEQLLELIDQFAAAEGRMKWAPNKKLHFEIAVIKAIQALSQATLTQVIETLAAMREGKAAPAPTARPTTAAPQTPRPVAEPAPRIGRPPAATPERAAAQPPPQPLTATESVKEEPSRVAAVAREEPSTFPDLWLALLAEVRKQRPLISAWVEAGTLLGIEGDVFAIGFPPSQKLAMESVMRPTNSKFLETLLAGLAGRPLTLKCELREGLVVNAPDLPETKPEPPPDPMATFKNDPLIKKALEIFKGEIQSA